MGFLNDLQLNTTQRIYFTLVDPNTCALIIGQGSNFLLQYCDSTMGFWGWDPGLVQGEVGNGWYYADLLAAMVINPGHYAVRISDINPPFDTWQNLLYNIQACAISAGSVNFTYTVVDIVTSLPIPATVVWITTDVGGANIVWSGITDIFGVARDIFGSLPALNPGTYYFWRQKVGYTFTNPDTEAVP